MPRETVFIPYAEDPDAGPPPFQIEVGWQKDHGDAGVQVGISTVDTGAGQKHLVDYVYGDAPTLLAIGQQALANMRVITDIVIGDFRTSEAEAEFFTEMGRAVLAAVSGSQPHVHGLGVSVWAHPTRSGINRLITLLRRARDAAHGADV